MLTCLFLVEKIMLFMGKIIKKIWDMTQVFPSILSNLCTYVQEMFVLFYCFLAECFNVFPTLNTCNSLVRKISLSPFTDEKRV